MIHGASVNPTGAFFLCIPRCAHASLAINPAACITVNSSSQLPVPAPCVYGKRRQRAARYWLDFRVARRSATSRLPMWRRAAIAGMWLARGRTSPDSQL